MESANWLSPAPVMGLIQVLQPSNAVVFLNGLYWLTLPLLPIVNGVLTVKWLRRGGGAEVSIPIFAAFYALVSLHLEGSMYWLLLSWADVDCVSLVRYVEPATATTALGCGSDGIGDDRRFLSAPANRSREVLATGCGAFAHGRPQPLLCGHMPRARLQIERADCESYRGLVEIIQAEVPPARHDLRDPRRCGTVFPGEPQESISLLQHGARHS